MPNSTDRPRWAVAEDWEFISGTGHWHINSPVGKVIRDIVVNGNLIKRPFPDPTHCLVIPGICYLAFTTDPLDDDPATCQYNICNVYTAPSHRRRGFASTLVRKVIRYAKKSGRPGVQCMAEPGTDLFWEAAGFHAIETAPIFGGCTNMTTVEGAA